MFENNILFVNRELGIKLDFRDTGFTDLIVCPIYQELKSKHKNYTRKQHNLNYKSVSIN